MKRSECKNITLEKEFGDLYVVFHDLGMDIYDRKNKDGDSLCFFNDKGTEELANCIMKIYPDEIEA